MKPTISKPFKSNDRTFDKVYNAFDKRDYFNSQGLAKTQIGNFERALKRNDKGAQQVLDMFKGDEKKAKDYIIQVISDRNKERAFNNYKAMKDAVDSIQKGKPNVGAVDYVKRIIHNSSQKYSIALYSTLRNKKFTKWKDVHNDIDSLIGEGFKSDAQRKAAFANGYEEKGKKKNESVNEIDTKKANLLRTNMPGYVGPKFAKKASDEDILAMADLKDQKARIYNRYVKVVDDAIAKLQKKYRIKESVNEGKAFVVMYKVKKDLPNRNVKPSSAAYSKEADAKKFLKSIEKDGGKGMIVKSNVRGMKEGKKRYYQQDRVGSAKYTISYHDGKKKHKDGSDFFDIQIFKNKKDLAKFVNTLHKGGYVYGFNESEDGVPQGYNPMVEDKNQIIQIKKKVGKSETKFYDTLSTIEKKLGKRKYRIWLEKSLKDFGENPKHYDYRTNASIEEKLFQIAK